MAKKSATLTDNGRQVAGYRQMLDAEDMLEKRVSQINGSSVGEINFGVIDSVTVSRLGRMTLTKSNTPISRSMSKRTVTLQP